MESLLCLGIEWVAADGQGIPVPGLLREPGRFKSTRELGQVERLIFLVGRTNSDDEIVKLVQPRRFVEKPGGGLAITAQGKRLSEFEGRDAIIGLGAQGDAEVSDRARHVSAFHGQSSAEPTKPGM